MANPCCVLCGEVVPFLRRTSLTVYRTGQLACSKCQKKYDNAPEEEREALAQRALHSPHLENRDIALKNQAFLLEEAQQRRAKEAERQAILQHRKERQKSVLQCCDQSMTALGVSTFQLGQESFFLGDLSNLLAGSMDLAVFRCGCCGQIKLFDPRFLADMTDQ